MTTELLAAAILDMNLHMLKDVKNLDVVSYEKKLWTSSILSLKLPHVTV